MQLSRFLDKAYSPQSLRTALISLLPFLVACEEENDKVLPIVIAASSQVPIDGTCVQTKEVGKLNADIIAEDCSPEFIRLKVGSTICAQIPPDGVYSCDNNDSINAYLFTPPVADLLEATVVFESDGNILNIEGEPYNSNNGIIYNESHFVDEISGKIIDEDGKEMLHPSQLFFSTSNFNL